MDGYLMILMKDDFLAGKSDYFGLNYYTSSMVAFRNRTGEPMSFDNDREIDIDVNPNWPNAKSKWLYSVPEGLRALLKYEFIFILQFKICELIFL